MPKVSICIPAYKHIDFLKRALDSCFIQEFTDFEVVITDDSPNWDVGDFILAYGHNDKIKYYKNDVSLGTPTNWNASIKKAEGLYIKILHHDDWFFDQYSLGCFVDLLDNNPSAAVGFLTSVKCCFEKNETEIIYPNKSWLEFLNSNPYNLLYGNAIGSPSASIFRNYPEFQYFDQKLKWFVDVEAYANLISTKGNCVAGSEKGIYIGISKRQITNDLENNEDVVIFELFYCLRIF